MSEGKTLHALSRNTISLIGSCQVITSVFSVAKELVENSLDAGASSVDIKLEDFGLGKIEVSDNGSGIKLVDVPFMAKRHFTSKISKSEDLDFLTTYGFRGEALGSLCAVSNVTITTKTIDDQLSYAYTIGPDGDVVDKKPSHNGKGTVVSSKNLFHNVPVRKQYYSGGQRKKEDLKRIEHLLMMYAIVKPDLRITLKHGKDLVFQKTALKDIKTALHSVLGRQISNQMLYKEKSCEELQIKICAFLPKPGSDIKDMSLTSADKTFTAVNKRPVSVSELNKVLKSYYSNCHGLDSYRYPVCFVSLDVATNRIDVNVDPNKTKVFFQQKVDIIKALEEILVEIYGPLENVPSWHYREADDEEETSKGENGAVPATPKEKKSTFRPFITYSKRPGDAEETTSESSGSKLNDSPTKGDPPSGSVPPLPSFSLTFHSKPSEEPTVASCVGSPNKNTIDSALVSGIDLPSNGDNNGSIVKNIDCDTDGNVNVQTLKEVASTKRGSESHSSKTDDVISDSVLMGESTINASKDNNDHSSSPQSENIDAVTPAQGVAVIECSVTNNGNVEDSIHPLGESSESAVSSGNDKDDVQTTSVPDINPNDWRKGNLTVGNTLLQPVKLLPPSSTHRPGKRPPSPSKAIESSQPDRKSAKLDTLSNQATLLDMISSQRIKKPESPFTHFFQEKCPDLSQEFPNEDMSALKERLKNEWENMTNDERVSYREKCWYDTKRYEKDKTSLNSQCDMKNLSGTELKPVKKGAEKLKKPLKKRLYCKERLVRIPMNEIRNSDQDAAKSLEEDDKPNIIGPADQSHDVWLCALQNKIYLVNVWRLAEVSLYKKLKSEHRLPNQPCDPTALDLRSINVEGLSVLKSLAKQCQGSGTYFHISDERLVANGFDVKCHFDSNGDLLFELVGISDVIPTYNLKDINSVLGIIAGDQAVSLADTRPLKVAYYLQSEAVRMTRQNGGKKTLHEAQTLLNAAVNRTNQPCLHHKPIFHQLFDFSQEEPDGD